MGERVGEGSMPAVWDRLRAGSTAETTPTDITTGWPGSTAHLRLDGLDEDKDEDEDKGEDQVHEDDILHAHVDAHGRSILTPAIWRQSVFDERISDLGGAETPSRFEIRRGKVVPQGQGSGFFDVLDSTAAGLHPYPAIRTRTHPRPRPSGSPLSPLSPPRSSLSPSRSPSHSTDSPAAAMASLRSPRQHAVYSPPASPPPGPPVNAKQASRRATGRRAAPVDQVSPPSSPDVLTPNNMPMDADRDFSPTGTSDDSLFDATPPSPPFSSQLPSQLPTAVALGPGYQTTSRSGIPQSRPDRRLNKAGTGTVSPPHERPSPLPPHQRALGMPIRRRSHDVVTAEPAPPAPTASPPAGQGIAHSTLRNAQDVIRRIRQGTTATAPLPPTSPDSFDSMAKPAGTAIASTTGGSLPPRHVPTSRPEWKGASGRQTILNPVQDQLNVPPLQITKQRRKLVAPDAPVGPPRQQIQFPSSSTASASGGLPQPTPLSGGNSTQPLSSHPFSSSSTARPDKPALRRQAAGPGHAPQLSTSSSLYSETNIPIPQPVPALPMPTAAPYTAAPYAATARSTTAAATVAQPTWQARPAVLYDAWTQPPSRLSATTCVDSPRASLDKDRAAVPFLAPSPSSVPSAPSPMSPDERATSMLHRKRPKIGGDQTAPVATTEPILVSLSPSWLTTPLFPKREDDELRGQDWRDGWRGQARRRTDTVQRLDEQLDNGEKALPLAPPELLSSTQDVVAQLNARLSALGNRRINIIKSIKQMTELMPLDSLLASAEVLRKREREKQKVEELRSELADIQRREYDVGLKLHRAYKRLEAKASYEPASLWVRRATTGAA